MLVDFETLPDTSKVWVYQANRMLLESEINEISKYLNGQVALWESHGSPLQASFQFFYDKFLVLGVNTEFQDPSGCSIDTSTRWLKNIQQNLNIDFFDRSIAYFENESLNFFPILEAKKQVLAGKISAETTVLNHQIGTLGELKSNWKLKASDSFMKKYFV
ncbi:hypothetical protein EGI22_07470 [Lacihabitans sp. LS3-19]|uniref:hypothetical protein n=1 Tax=Lacihabitans sp. LS3-19 TaxID=2487335 RepID=UPI0020CD5F1C|nr:hypothetical protein [Lacihabitans sp. LS3-19]MCP9767748.1 hypothetical protein [Lacihabitans sp. LS3-19]